MSEAPPGHQHRRLRVDRTGWGARSWLEVAVGRNPLIGRTHRHEAWIFVAAALLLAVATVLSVSAAAAVYTARVTHYQAEQPSWTQTLATATEFSAMPADSHKPIHQVQACWLTFGQQRCDTIDVAHPVAEGQAVPIWIDRDGQYLRTPEPAGQALIDASITALLVWCASAGLIAAICKVWRRSLARSRDANLDAALATLLTETGRDDHRPGQ